MISRKNKPVPLQIIGTQRSGSNLLRLILNQSDEISAHHPPHILTVFFPILHKYGNLELPGNFEKLVDDVCRLIEANPVKWGLPFDRKEVVRRCSQYTLIEVFKVVYEMVAEKDGAKYWCCKSMANVTYFEDLEHGGVKPYYIHLIRDGRDVATSFKKTLVGEKHPFHLARVWKENINKAQEVSKLVDEERYLTIQYETLVSEPMKIVGQLNTFLDLGLDASALDYFSSDESKKTAAAGFMWSNLTKPILRNNTWKFMKEMTDDEISIFERVAGKELQEYGYRLVSTTAQKKFLPEEIQKFEKINRRLKFEAMNSPHLKIDKEHRIDRKKLLKELNA